MIRLMIVLTVNLINKMNIKRFKNKIRILLFLVKINIMFNHYKILKIWIILRLQMMTKAMNRIVIINCNKIKINKMIMIYKINKMIKRMYKIVMIMSLMKNKMINKKKIHKFNNNNIKMVKIKFVNSMISHYKIL
jgi:hypothetical protein